MKDEDGQLRKVKSSGKHPLPNRYRPNLEQINELILELASNYLYLIGILRGAVLLGCIDILTEIAVMSQ